MLKALLFIFTFWPLQLLASAEDEKNKAALLAAYPGLFTFQGNELVWSDGDPKRILWDDGKKKTAQQLIDNADLQDMFTYEYPLVSEGNLEPGKDEDPGRIRQEAFFKKIYGIDSKGNSHSIVTIPWLPKIGKDRLNVTSLFSIQAKLVKISQEIENLPSKFHKYALKPAGGYNPRKVAGSHLLSAHTYGAAVDINIDFTNYWHWLPESQREDGHIEYVNRIPLEIVAIFEKYGFIWGGRWYHYDSMHFEYRPELLK